MISSMTGYGRGEAKEGRTTAMAEVRTVNSRFLEVISRLPRTLSLRENEVKELVRTRFVRGKVNVVLGITHETESDAPLKVNTAIAKSYYKLLSDLRKSVKIQEKITIDHLLKFPDVLEINEFDKGDDCEWNLLQKALTVALDEAARMRLHEGCELAKDLEKRIIEIEHLLDEIDKIAVERIPEKQSRLQKRLKELLADQTIIDNNRLEQEIALFADKLDVTEECVRFRSHNKFFIEALRNDEAAGRKLNFLIQEMHREVNTIGSKADNAEIAHRVVVIKEGLEKIREQLQNIE